MSTSRPSTELRCTESVDAVQQPIVNATNVTGPANEKDWPMRFNAKTIQAAVDQELARRAALTPELRSREEQAEREDYEAFRTWAARHGVIEEPFA